MLGIPDLEPILYGAWLMRPIRRPLRSSYSYLVSLMVRTRLAGQCSRLATRDCGPSTVIGCRDDIMVYLYAQNGVGSEDGLAIMERAEGPSGLEDF